ncbi:hypothetical protein CPB85DRAFT_1257922 [Mucidula mucida]|nr:hypothetical protein CPB85DRAFT_1257922 [Mucidula mucida]
MTNTLASIYTGERRQSLCGEFGKAIKDEGASVNNLVSALTSVREKRRWTSPSYPQLTWMHGIKNNLVLSARQVAAAGFIACLTVNENQYYQDVYQSDQVGGNDLFERVLLMLDVHSLIVEDFAPVVGAILFQVDGGGNGDYTPVIVLQLESVAVKQCDYAVGAQDDVRQVLHAYHAHFMSHWKPQT